MQRITISRTGLSGLALVIGLVALIGNDVRADDFFLKPGIPADDGFFEKDDWSAGDDPVVVDRDFDQMLLVPSEYATIQEAVDAADDGDTIYVDSQWPLEPFTVYQKNLVIRGNAQESHSLVSWGPGAGSGAGVLVIDSTLVMEHLWFAGFRSSVGGAIEVHDSEIHVRSCKFTGNMSVAADPANARGGAIYFDSPGMWNASTVTDCHFELNEAKGNGGAVYVAAGWLDIMGCKFIQNEATEGGAVCYAGGQGTIETSTFLTNMAWKGGGVRMTGPTTLQVASCDFSGNKAYFGGGLHAGDIMSGHTSGSGRAHSRFSTPKQSCILRTCSFGSNYAHGDGGGIYLVQGSHYMFSCSLSLNHAGGAGAALFIEESYATSTARLHATRICGNGHHIPGGSASQLVGRYVDEGANCISEYCSDFCDNKLDVNRDGYIDWADWSQVYNAMVTLIHTTGSNSYFPIGSMIEDINSDGLINRNDYNLIARHIRGAR